jgi:hypothetical protein
LPACRELSYLELACIELSCLELARRGLAVVVRQSAAAATHATEWYAQFEQVVVKD